jgi:flagellar basal-body rod modification protein FlgD
VTSVANTNPTTPTSSDGAAVVNPSTNMNEQDFLKLLVAQLRYQDPMSPSDNQQFVQEQAQFSMVEGITNLEKTLSAMSSSQQLAQGVDLIGKQVTYATSDGSTATGVVSSVSTASGTLTVHVGDTDIDPSTIVGVSAAPAPTQGGAAGA